MGSRQEELTGLNVSVPYEPHTTNNKQQNNNNNNTNNNNNNNNNDNNNDNNNGNNNKAQYNTTTKRKTGPNVQLGQVTRTHLAQCSYLSLDQVP
mmetsp:Transcript_16097/g.32226  ORF Transcript_16097/g.32226 Transcript_16097/m.32226 type:complete len:94 (-) Transcript_16097:130-411(-)